MKTLAIAFNSDLPYPRVLEALNRLGPWRWRDRDSAWYGNLASARVKTTDGPLRLALMESGTNEIGGSVEAGQGRRYCISAELRAEGEPAGWAAVQAAIVDLLLPAIGARDLCDTDPIDA